MGNLIQILNPFFAFSKNSKEIVLHSTKFVYFGENTFKQMFLGCVAEHFGEKIMKL